jgi:hypothetical protein
VAHIANRKRLEEMHERMLKEQVLREASEDVLRALLARQEKEVLEHCTSAEIKQELERRRRT